MGFFDSPDVYADPSMGGLAGMAQGFAQAAMPSRMPIPFGAALGMAAGGMQKGASEAQQFAAQQQQLRAAQMNNQFLQASMPTRLSLLGAAAGGIAPQQGAQPGQGAPPLSGGIGTPGYQAPGAAAPGGAPGAYALDPRTLQQAGMYALASGQDRAAAAMFGAAQDIAKTGRAIAPDGSVVVAPGAAAALFNTAAATSGGEAAGKIAPTLALKRGESDIAVDQAGRVAGAEAQYKPPTQITNPDGSTSYIPTANLPAVNAGGGGQSPAVNALSSIPDPNLRQAAVNAALKANLPPEAWPAWISAVHNESQWNPAAPMGGAGEVGIGQVKPDTAKSVGVNPSALNDPQANLLASAKYFGQKWKEGGGDPAKALAGYNSGSVSGNVPAYVTPAMQRVQAWGGGGGAAAIPGAMPGAPSPLQHKEMEAEGERLGKLPQPIIDAGREGATALMRINQAQTAMQNASDGGLPPGKFTPLLAQVMAGAKSLGIDTSKIGVDPKAVGNEQVAQEAVTQIGGEILKRLFPQRITNADVKIFGEKLAQYGMDPAALNTVLGITKAQAQYDVDRSNSLLAYQKNKGSLKGWESEFYGKNGYGPDLFQSGAMQPAGVQTAAAPTPPPAPHPDPAKREPGIYTTPKGQFKWTGNGWQAP